MAVSDSFLNLVSSLSTLWIEKNICTHAKYLEDQSLTACAERIVRHLDLKTRESGMCAAHDLKSQFFTVVRLRACDIGVLDNPRRHEVHAYA